LAGKARETLLPPRPGTTSAVAARDSVEGAKHAKTILVAGCGLVAALLAGFMFVIHHELGTTRVALQAQINEIKQTLSGVRVDVARVQERVDLLPEINAQLEGIKTQLETRISQPNALPTDPRPAAHVGAPVSTVKTIDLGQFSPLELVAASRKVEKVGNLVGTVVLTFNDAATANASLAGLSVDFLQGGLKDHVYIPDNVVVIPVSIFKVVADTVLANSVGQVIYVSLGTTDEKWAKVLKRN